MSSPDQSKTGLRAVLKKKRHALPDQLRESGQAGMNKALLAFLQDFPVGVVAGYYPVNSEISVLGALEALETVGWQVVLPVVVARDQPLEFRAWNMEDRLEEGLFGIPEPYEGAVTVSPDIMIVPLLGFDNRGYRLGYGGGFYDRSLAQARKAARKDRQGLLAIGVAHGVQEVTSALPVDCYDERLDIIIAGQKVYNFSTLS